MAEDFVAELARIAGARHDDRRTLEMTDPADREAEPFELADRGLGRWRPHDLLQQIARFRPLDGDVVQLIGRRSHPGLEAHFFRLLPEPQAGKIIAADP